jgi:aspartate/methionine/tyrosine aminotransferase
MNGTDLWYLDPEERAKLYVEEQSKRRLLAGGLSPINLSTAENVLLFDQLKQLFEQRRDFTESDAEYVSKTRRDKLHELIANFLSDSYGLSGGNRLVRDNVVGLSGVSAALESLAFSLCSPGDTVLTPSPCWQGFDWCFRYRPKVKLVKFPAKPDRPFELTPEAVIDAYNREGAKPKVLLLTNPDNPLGVNHKKETLERIYEWAMRETEMHIISDEIYFNSQVAQPRVKFTSAFGLGAYRGSEDRIHVVWGFSKDFGLSGFRAGFVITRAANVIKSLMERRMYFFSPFTSLTNMMVIDKLLEHDQGRYIRRLTAEYSVALTRQFSVTRGELERRKIKFYDQSEAAQFLWLDLSEYLDRAPDCPDPIMYSEITDERERKLDCYIRKEAGVLLLPGQVLSSPVPGWFRLCLTCNKLDVITEAVNRIADALGKLAPN